MRLFRFVHRLTHAVRHLTRFADLQSPHTDWCSSLRVPRQQGHCASNISFPCTGGHRFGLKSVTMWASVPASQAMQGDHKRFVRLKTPCAMLRPPSSPPTPPTHHHDLQQKNQLRKPITPCAPLLSSMWQLRKLITPCASPSVATRATVSAELLAPGLHHR